MDSRQGQKSVRHIARMAFALFLIIASVGSVPGIARAATSVSVTASVLNASPVVTNVKICLVTEAGDCMNNIPIYPNVGADKTFRIYADVNDENGNEDITSVSAKFYREPVTSGCASDGNNCYTGMTCSVSSTYSEVTQQYICLVTVNYWIDPTVLAADDYPNQNWIISVTATDSSNASTIGANSTKVDQVLALAGFPSAVDFGIRSLGSMTTAADNFTATVTQAGNVDADIEIYANSATMVCSGIGAIPIGNQKFKSYSTTNVGYAASTKTLTQSAQLMQLYDGSASDGAIRRRTTDSGYTAAGHVAFNILIPDFGVKGSCGAIASVSVVKHSVAGGGG
jgi:hypothetical protein